MNASPRKKVCCCFGNLVGRETILGRILDSKQQRNFGEIRKFLVKQEKNKLPFRQEKTRKLFQGM
jgi:hypothetical protein